MIELGSSQTFIIAILVLFLGKKLNKEIPFLREYNIPEPVTGGVLASLVFAAFYFLADKEIVFSLADRDTLFLVFFTALGLSTRIQTLIEGGKSLAILFTCGIVYLFIQNFIGIAVMEAAGLNPVIGLIGGSVSLGGGFGHAIAWSELFRDEYGISNAAEIALACATFGLLLGGLIGGPIAKLLINRYKLESTSAEEPLVGVKHEKVKLSIDYYGMLNALLVVAVAVGVGIYLDAFLSDIGLNIPTFISCLAVGIVLTNTFPHVFKNVSWPTGTPSLALISDLSLGLFLSISLMSLRVWTLVELAGPIIILLILQVVIFVPLVILVIFKLLGKSYDSAVISAGYAGQGLGATPTALANMAAVTKRFGASPKAFIVIPLVGPFVGGITNTFIIKFFLGYIL